MSNPKKKMINTLKILKETKYYLLLYILRFIKDKMG